MSPNLPDPGKIPDMSLGERRDKQLPPTHISSSYQPAPADEPVAPSPLNHAQSEPHWQEGDRVLALWEPIFLYPGLIEQIVIDEARGDQALIAFDDGRVGWVFLYSLCPVEIYKRLAVQARHNRGTDYHPAEIVEISDEEIRVCFDDGAAEWTTITNIRIPCVENGPGAAATRLAPWHPANPPVPASAGVPSWIIWVGVGILLAILRIGCRSM